MIQTALAWLGRTRSGAIVSAAAVAVSAAAVAASAPAASAAITPALSSPQTAPVQAGTTGNLELDMKFAPTGSDSPRQLTLNLPPGLLTSAAIDDGGCLQTTDIETDTCQIGSGVVTANLGDASGVATPVDFFLVPPPAAGDLAGLAVATGGQQIGTTAPIVIRPSGDPDGVGASIDLTLPNTLAGQSLQITEIDSTFDGLRFPTTCPSTPAQLTVSADSYGDPSTKTAALALPVTGCGSLPYAPKYGLSVTRDKQDRQVTVVTRVTQAPSEAPSSSLSLAFPSSVLAPGLGGLGDLCASIGSGTCTPVGSVTAESPLYPTPLTGSAYLTGNVSTSVTGLTLTLVFPPPFPLTLVGKVDLQHLATTFSGLPDIPLTSLGVTLDGGKSGLFLTLCTDRSGTSTVTATDQNGDKHATENAPFTVSGCPAGTGQGSGGGSGHGGQGPGGPGHGGAHPGKPKVTSATVGGLASGKPKLKFTAIAGAHAPKLSSLTVTVPKGLRLVARHLHGKVSVQEARLGSATVSHGRLVIRLRKPAAHATVKLGAGALTESAALKAKAKRLKRIRLTVLARNASGHTTRVQAQARVRP